MKSIKLLIFAAGILLIGLLNACESDNKDYPATIGFTNTTAVDSIYAGDAYTLTGTVKAEGAIQSVQFYRSYPFNNTQDSVEMAATKIVNIKGNTCNFSIDVPNVTYKTDIWVEVTETNGHVVPSKFTINMRTSNIIGYKNITMGGWDSNFGSALDADTGTPYGSSRLGTVGSIVDVFFDHAELASRDLDAVDFYPGDYNGARFPETGTTFAATTFTSSDFDGFKGDDSFKTMTGTLKDITIKVGDVIFFQTKSGKKGLLRVSAMTAPTGDLVLDEKIQK